MYTHGEYHYNERPRHRKRVRYHPRQGEQSYGYTAAAVISLQLNGGMSGQHCR